MLCFLLMYHKSCDSRLQCFSWVICCYNLIASQREKGGHQTRLNIMQINLLKNNPVFAIYTHHTVSVKGWVK